MKRFVEANMNASADSGRAPFVHSARVAARAAKEHDDEMKPSPAAKPTSRTPPPPSRSAASFGLTKTWMAAEQA